MDPSVPMPDEDKIRNAVDIGARLALSCADNPEGTWWDIFSELVPRITDDEMFPILHAVAMIGRAAAAKGRGVPFEKTLMGITQIEESDSIHGARLFTTLANNDVADAWTIYLAIPDDLVGRAVTDLLSISVQFVRAAR